MPQAASTGEATHRVVIIICKLYEIMETKINIAEILRIKPQGTKLYDLLYNVDEELDTISTTDTETVVWCTETDNNTTCHRSYSEFGTVRGCPDGLQILLPSKDMRDWHKFAWKKGDVLVSSEVVYIIFEKFENDTYTRFKGKHYLWKEGNEEDYAKEETCMLTSVFEKENDDVAECYINTIEERLGGKLNLETLEIEKPQPEFKDGDIITIMPHIGDKLIYLFKTEDGEKYYGHAYLDGNIAIINEDSYCQKDFNTARPSTEKEKQQLFDALAKEGKRWNAEKKVIEDIKKEYQFKPFEKVLVRDSKDSLWHIDLYEGALGDDNEYNYSCMAADWVYCIPYEGNEHLLGTTKDVEEDYEGNQE